MTKTPKPNHPGLRKVNKVRLETVRRYIGMYGDTDYKLAFQLGIRAAAEFAGTFDGQIDHWWRMEDVILVKFNLIKGTPRRKELML